MQHRYKVTVESGNRKLGRMATTMTSRSTCPDSCPVKKEECYAEAWPMKMHWDRLDKGERALTFNEYLVALRNLRYGSMVRGQQAGDMPGDGVSTLEHDKCLAIADAMVARRKIAWTYCAYVVKHNIKTWLAMLTKGFAVNKSCYSLDEVDEAMDLGVPATMIWKSTFKGRNQTTPKGRKVVGCPAQLSKEVTCSSCGGAKGPLCARIDRKFAVGFYAHGIRKKKLDAKLDEYRGGKA